METYSSWESVRWKPKADKADDDCKKGEQVVANNVVAEVAHQLNRGYNTRIFTELVFPIQTARVGVPNANFKV